MPKKKSRDEIIRFKAGRKLKNYSMQSRPGTFPGVDEFLTPLGAGGSGVVYLAHQHLTPDVTIKRALKFFIFRDDIINLTIHDGHTPVSQESFLNEVINISSFSHENLTKVTDAGLHAFGGRKIPYLVTEYVPGPTLQQICDYSGESGGAEIAAIRLALVENPVLLLDLLIQVAEAISHLHVKHFAHCDIAPKNIFITNQDGVPRPILGDLGVGQSLNSKKSKIFVAGSKDYMPPEVLEHRYKEVDWVVFNKFYPYWDLYSYAKSGLECVEKLRPQSLPSWWRPLSISFSRCIDKLDYLTIQALLSRLRWLLPIHREIASVPELSSSLSGKSRKLMPVASLVTSARIRKLIQHPGLLRLAKVPQLMTAQHVFPSGNHTRYEHSLGVLETFRQYLIALLDQEEFLEHLTAEKIETGLLLALFFNAGKYPLSHVIYELAQDEPARYEKFSRVNIHLEVLNIRDAKGRTLKDLIALHFPSVSIDTLEKLLNENGDMSEQEQLIHSMLNCSLDARVVDFLRRDSHHLGLANDGFHLDDLLPHLTIRNHKLALKATGISIAEHIISLRYWMFSRIYWSRPNRTFVAMMRHLLIQLSADSVFLDKYRHQLLSGNQDDALLLFSKEAERLGRFDLVNLAGLLIMAPQELYWVAFEANKKEHPEFGAIIDRMADWGLADFSKLQEMLTAHLSLQLDPERKHADKILILVDIPIEPGGGNKLGGDMMGVFEDGRIAQLTEISGIIHGVNDGFAGYLRRFRVFVHPDIAPREEKTSRLLHESIAGFLLKKI